MQRPIKLVLGNAHMMESQRLTSAESLLRNGDITVREFVRQEAKSDLYQSLFFHTNSAYRFIELNCKHLLGRAPLEQTEISDRVQICNGQGYEAEIDYYIDSDDYSQNFGENIVPYPRSIRSQTGIQNVGFNRMLSLLGGAATSDSSNQAQLVATVASNRPQKIKLFSIGTSGASSTTGKRFRITATKSGGAKVRVSKISYEVSYAQMSQQIKNIQKMGGKILSITEVG
ncbi:MAG: phycobilisome rod-core linker polypeptide [Microcoleus sp.]